MTIPAFRPCVGDEELALIRDVFDRRWFGLGEMNARFEAKVAKCLGARHVVAVNSGTAALQLALEAFEFEPGSEVLMPSLSFVALPQAIRNAGLTPVFCEVEPDTVNIDVDDAMARRTSRTRAIIPVHYAGEPCAMERLLDAFGDMVVIEDAAHAFGSTWRGQALGTIGDVGCFSFNAIKNVSCGEGGAVVTERGDLAESVRRRRMLGIDQEGWRRQTSAQPWAYRVEGDGHRMHMSDLNAAIGLAQLDKMTRFRTRKLEIARRYDEAFASLPAVLPLPRSETTFPFSYVVRVTDGSRDSLAAALRDRDIQSLVQFIPNHLQPAFAKYRVDLPVTERVFDEILSLPFYVEMTEADVTSVIEGVRDFMDRPPITIDICVSNPLVATKATSQ